MSHCEMTPRAGFGSAVWARAQGRAVAEGAERVQSWSDGVRWNFALSRRGDWGVVDFAGAEGGRVRGLAHGDALGKRKGSGGGILGFGPWSLVLLVRKVTHHELKLASEASRRSKWHREAYSSEGVWCPGVLDIL